MKRYTVCYKLTADDAWIKTAIESESQHQTVGIWNNYARSHEALAKLGLHVPYGAQIMVTGSGSNAVDRAVQRTRLRSV